MKKLVKNANFVIFSSLLLWGQKFFGYQIFLHLFLLQSNWQEKIMQFWYQNQTSGSKVIAAKVKGPIIVAHTTALSYSKFKIQQKKINRKIDDQSFFISKP